jgi:hypothetical protein
LTNLPLTGIDGQPLAVSLHGRIDRVDMRADGHMVLDYKTGGFKSGGAETWLDEALFSHMAEAAPGSPEAALLLDEISESGLDLQLPLYLHLLAADATYKPSDAAWIELKSDGSERPLFGDKATPEERALVMTRHAPMLARLVLEHALTAPEFAARPGRHCQWCDFKGPCCA